VEGNATLKEVLELSRKILRARDENPNPTPGQQAAMLKEADQLSTACLTLDEYLRKGGMLPLSWALKTPEKESDRVIDLEKGP
jgi:hypothetical protein